MCLSQNSAPPFSSLGQLFKPVAAASATVLHGGHVMRAMNFRTSVLAASIGLIATATAAAAEPWPQRTVRVIVPFGAGIATDFTARLFAERLAVRWKQPV